MVHNVFGKMVNEAWYEEGYEELEAIRESALR